jgi:hypothetical protein
MKFREKYKADHGIEISEAVKKNGIYPCPSKFGYEAKNPAICRRLLDCKSCWEREMEDKMDAEKLVKEISDRISDNMEKVVWRKNDEHGVGREDFVNHPSHYTKGGIECIDCIESVISSGSDPIQAFLVGQVVKYLYRYTMKNGLEDLRKAQWYLNRLISKVKQ